MCVIVIPFIGIKYNNYIQSLFVSFLHNDILHNFIANQHVHGTLYLCTFLLLLKMCGISLFASEMVGEKVTKCGGAFSPIFICEPNSCKN
jgi:hypothetical protein